MSPVSLDRQIFVVKVLNPSVIFVCELRSGKLLIKFSNPFPWEKLWQKNDVSPGQPYLEAPPEHRCVDDFLSLLWCKTAPYSLIVTGNRLDFV